MQIHHPAIADGYRTDLPERRDVLFTSGKDLCHAWLYLPAGVHAGHSLPIVVMAHGIGGVKCGGLAPFAERFQAAGYACLVFDYRYFGQSAGTPRELLDIPSQRADWRAAVTYARSLPQVDPARVIAWGTSFGGGHAIVTAADDAKIAAAIVQCPFTDGLASGLAVSPLTSLKVALLAARDKLAAWARQVPVRVATAGRPGTAALMTAPDAVAGLNAVNRASGLPDTPTMVTARAAFQIMFDAPGRRAANVRCPILYVVCANDSVAPAKTTLRHAKKSSLSEVCLYPEGHFSIYLGGPFERNMSDQIEFLRRHVPTSRS